MKKKQQTDIYLTDLIAIVLLVVLFKVNVKSLIIILSIFSSLLLLYPLLRFAGIGKHYPLPKWLRILGLIVGFVIEFLSEFMILGIIFLVGFIFIMGYASIETGQIYLLAILAASVFIRIVVETSKGMPQSSIKINMPIKETKNDK